MTPLAYLALGPADYLMAHVMLLRGIKQRAERTSASDVEATLAEQISAPPSAPAERKEPSGHRHSDAVGAL
jgi:hypothetical protein